MTSMEKQRIKRIMFIISSMSANGAERVMSLLVNNAAKQGIDVMLALVSKNIVEYTIDKRVHIVFCGGSSTIHRIKNLRKVMIDFNPEVAVSFLTTCNIYACIASFGLKIPVVVSERNDPNLDCPSKWRRFVRDVSYVFASGFIFQTDEAAECFSDRIKKKAAVIANPVKDNLPLADYYHSKAVFVAAGRLTKQKNYPMMIRAFAEFHKTHPEYTLSIFGDGELHDELMDMIESLQMTHAIILEGAVKDLHQRMILMRGFILSSDYEGISNSLLEALAMGLPCISTDCPCGGSRHLIQNGKTGILVDVGDEEAFCLAMKKMADDPDFARVLGQNAIDIRETRSEDAIIGQYYEYIRRICT